MINRKVEEWSSGQTAQNMKASTKTARNMAVGNFVSERILATMDNSTTMIFMAMEFIFGPMEGSTKESGDIIKLS